MAEVFLAERRADGGFRQKVALKRIHPRHQSNSVLLERFVTEARTNARLAHPNIARILDFGTQPEPYLALEYVEGASVSDLMYRLFQWRQRVDVSLAMYTAIGVAQALNHAHRLQGEDGTPLGIVHRDVAPKNVLLSLDGTPTLLDFGLVQVADNFLETHGATPVGTYCYMAPEQLAGGHVDARADLYSLGVLLWELLTTRQLISTNDPREVTTLQRRCDFPPPSTFHSDVPPDLDDLTMQCLRYAPDDRPPSAEALSVPLQRMLHERSAGYGAEQVAKTIHWAFPEREWSRKQPQELAAQPQPQDRTRLAWKARSERPPRPDADGSSPVGGLGCLTRAVLISAIAVFSFFLGVFVGSYM